MITAMQEATEFITYQPGTDLSQAFHQLAGSVAACRSAVDRAPHFKTAVRPVVLTGDVPMPAVSLTDAYRIAETLLDGPDRELVGPDAPALAVPVANGIRTFAVTLAPRPGGWGTYAIEAARAHLAEHKALQPGEHVSDHDGLWLDRDADRNILGGTVNAVIGNVQGHTGYLIFGAAHVR